MTMLPPDEKAKVEKQIKQILDKGDDKKWTNESEGVFEYPYKTWVVIARKK